ncbi:MAG: hypothetical protein QNJ73_08010 [Gammaproteobacteria bacterium]|nr:hypothetical protein [Gammaproteobacteria bacterium]
MSTQTIFLFAIAVFGLMAVGIVLTVMEFNRLSDSQPQRRTAEGKQNDDTA